jgi:hypothetical protein
MLKGKIPMTQGTWIGPVPKWMYNLISPGISVGLNKLDKA